MYPRNAASPEPIAIGAVVQISDGAVQTSGVTVRIKPIGVAEGDGGGTTAYSTDGIVLYTPTQAETNYTSFILIAKKTGCIPVSVTVVTTASVTPGTVLLAPVTHTSATVPTVTTTTTATNVTTVNGLAAGVITATAIANNAITDAKVASDVTIASVTGSVGSVVGLTASNLDATVSSRASQTSVDDVPTNAELATALAAADDAVLAAIAALNNLSQANIRTAVGLASANLDTQIGTLATTANLAIVAGYLDTEIVAILADTNELQTDLANGGRLDLLIDAIKAKTDSMTFTVAGFIDSNLQYVNDIQVIGEGVPTTDPWRPV